MKGRHHHDFSRFAHLLSFVHFLESKTSRSTTFYINPESLIHIYDAVAESAKKAYTELSSMKELVLLEIEKEKKVNIKSKN